MATVSTPPRASNTLSREMLHGCGTRNTPGYHNKIVKDYASKLYRLMGIMIMCAGSAVNSRSYRRSMLKWRDSRGLCGSSVENVKHLNHVEDHRKDSSSNLI